MKETIQPPRETVVGLASLCGKGRDGGLTFCADVAENEEGEDPGELVFKCFSSPACARVGIARVFKLVDFA
jgi:hypothetical protein